LRRTTTRFGADDSDGFERSATLGFGDTLGLRRGNTKALESFAYQNQIKPDSATMRNQSPILKPSEKDAIRETIGAQKVAPAR
jgi:hypothetical protein